MTLIIQEYCNRGKRPEVSLSWREFKSWDGAWQRKEVIRHLSLLIGQETQSPSYLNAWRWLNVATRHMQELRSYHPTESEVGRSLLWD
jgi:hypothetical protein